MDDNKIKRIADWLEKVSVASFAVGVFQENQYGLVLAAVMLLTSLFLTSSSKEK